MTADLRGKIREQIVQAFAAADDMNLDDPKFGRRYRDLSERKASSLLSSTEPPSDLPPSITPLLEAYRENERALERDRSDRIGRIAEHNEAFKAKRNATYYLPDEPDHRRLVLLDEATGLRYRIRLPVEILEAVGHHPKEIALEGQGKPFVRKAKGVAR